MTHPATKRAGVLAITARPERGFWRCDVKHLPTRTIHPAGRFTLEQLAELKAEPELIVEELQDDPGLKKSVGAEGGKSGTETGE